MDDSSPLSHASETVAIGIQRLSNRPAAQAATAIESALQHGLQWIDTADMYGIQPGDAERLLAPFTGRVKIATKGGLKREGTRWLHNGRAQHLQQAAAASRQRLGVDTLDLYLLHAPDPRTAWATSVRALAQLHERGEAARVGVCNVNVRQLRQAAELAPISCVQVELSPFASASVSNGVIEVARTMGIEVWAYRALGGERSQRRIAKHHALFAAAAALGNLPTVQGTSFTNQEIALAWLRTLGVVPLAGPSQEATVLSAIRAARLRLPPAIRASLDDAFPFSKQLRIPRAERAPSPDAPGEVCIVMGSPGAGKTTRVQPRVQDGYVRLNRDTMGGTLRKLLTKLDAALTRGERRVVLDNTYPSRAARNGVIEVAWKHGVPVRCEWLITSDEDCERNVIERVLDAVGHLPEPEDFDRLAKRDPGVIGPRALFRYRKQLEPPEAEEGFAQFASVPFVRNAPPGIPAVFVDPRHQDPEVWQVLRDLSEQGVPTAIVGWHPGVDTTEVDAAAVAQAASRGVTAFAASCPHPGGPPACWCRKPLAGLAVWLARRHGLDLERSVVFATTASDRTFARKLGAHTASSTEALRQLGNGHDLGG